MRTGTARSATTKRKSAKTPAKQRTAARGARRPAKAATSSAAGAAAVRAYITALPAGQRPIAQRFDALIARLLPSARRVIKWGMPFYGIPGRGWIVSCGGFPKFVKITFFQGIRLRPLPPVISGSQMRCVDLARAADFDPKTIAAWVRQAAKLPGFAPASCPE
jgi:hypothetical protein